MVLIRFSVYPLPKTNSVPLKINPIGSMYAIFTIINPLFTGTWKLPVVSGWKVHSDLSPPWLVIPELVGKSVRKKSWFSKKISPT